MGSKQVSLVPISEGPLSEVPLYMYYNIDNCGLHSFWTYTTLHMHMLVAQMVNSLSSVSFSSTDCALSCLALYSHTNTFTSMALSTWTIAWLPNTVVWPLVRSESGVWLRQFVGHALLHPVQLDGKLVEPVVLVAVQGHGSWWGPVCKNDNNFQFLTSV